MNLTGRETSPYGWGRILWLGLAVLSFDAAIGPVAFALGFGVDFFGVLLTIDFFVIAIADSSETWILDYFCLGFGHSMCQITIVLSTRAQCAFTKTA